MAKIYLDNYRLIAARSLIFKGINIDADNYLNSVIKFKSGDFLPVKDIIEGKHKVYGGGGSTGNKHNNFNVKDYTIGIGRVGARCGCVFIIEPNSWVTDNALYAAEINGRYNLEFLLHWLNYNNLNQYANTSAQPVISLKRISGVLIPKISLEKQVEIAKLLDTIENGKKIVNDQWGISQLLESIQNIETLNIGFDTQSSYLTQLRQAILQEAIEGKLTADWRKENPVRKGDPDFDAEALLEKIKTEKEKLIAEGKIRKQKSLAPIKPEEVPFELPERWILQRLGEICSKITDGTHHSPANTLNGMFKYITAKNIKDSGLDLSKITYVTKQVHDEIYSRCNVEFEDILYIKDGATTGIVTINNLNEPFSMLSSVALLKPMIFNRFLMYAMRSPIFYNETRSQMYGVAITRVTLIKIINSILPIPPIKEQHVIVERIDKLLVMVDALQKQVSQRKEQSEMLMQAVLREVFDEGHNV